MTGRLREQCYGQEGHWDYMWLWWEGSGSTDLQAHPPRSRDSDILPPGPAPKDGSLSGPHQVEHPEYRPD